MKLKVSLVFLLLYLVVGNSACEKKGGETQVKNKEVTTSQRDSQSSETLPLNVQLTNQAWEAFNNDDHERTLSYAQRCIDEFLGGAERKQLQLETEKAALPPTGTVSEQEKEAISALGLLNDVATCLFIKGRCEEALGHKEEATKAYQAASKYTYARCWDPKGWFWSPSEAALDRLSVLKLRPSMYGYSGR